MTKPAPSVPQVHTVLGDRRSPRSRLTTLAGQESAQRPTEQLGALAAVAAAESIAAVAAELARHDDVTELARAAARGAGDVVPGCAAAAVIVGRSGSRCTLLAASDEVAERCAALETEAGEGPAREAVGSGVARLVPDTAADDGYRGFGPRAARAGAGSAVAVPLVGRRGVFGALALYAAEPGTFDTASARLAASYAVHVGAAYDAADVEANLRVALASRELIARAVGILMNRHRITADAGFQLLADASQQAHLKLREVAQWVNDTGADPQAMLASR